MKPMLARPFKERLIKWPGYVQPKLNGLRCLYHFNSRTMESRDEHMWNYCVLPHIHDALHLISDDLQWALGEAVALDGEIYCHGLSLQQINSRGSVNRVEPHANYEKLEFHVFDIVVDLPMKDRVDLLSAVEILIPSNFPIKIVPTHYCDRQQTFDELYLLYHVQQNYEGVMWRDPDASYGFSHNCTNKENRWDCIVKRKPRQDLLAHIIGRVEGEGKYLGSLGSLHLATVDGVSFYAGSGLTDAERQALWNAPIHEVLQVPVRVDYEMLSDSGVPLKPTIACVMTNLI